MAYGLKVSSCHPLMKGFQDCYFTTSQLVFTQRSCGFLEQISDAPLKWIKHLVQQYTKVSPLRVCRDMLHMGYIL